MRFVAAKNKENTVNKYDAQAHEIYGNEWIGGMIKAKHHDPEDNPLAYY